MKLLIVACLVAISYAQTDCSETDANYCSAGDCYGSAPGFQVNTIRGYYATSMSTSRGLVNEATKYADCAAFCTTSCWGFNVRDDLSCTTYVTDPTSEHFMAGDHTVFKKDDSACPGASSSSSGASSHGDPIIWTFKGECYDLNKDGLYLASSHPEWGHEVFVAVYNEFIREIQIRSTDNTLLFSISNLNELSGEWQYGLKQWDRRMCRTMSWKECEFSYKQYAFDALIFRYTVQIMFHDYLDPALKDGQRGLHLDIYPKVYDNKIDGFVPEQYEGIYFDNPYPEELHYCPADSTKRA